MGEKKGDEKKKKKVYGLFKILYSLEELEKLATVMQVLNLVTCLLFFSACLYPYPVD